jgi:hypothetical protein
VRASRYVPIIRTFHPYAAVLVLKLLVDTVTCGKGGFLDVLCVTPWTVSPFQAEKPRDELHVMKQAELELQIPAVISGSYNS